MQNVLKHIEAHIEKGVLAVCGVFLLYVTWGYLLNTPNKTRFAGQELEPGNLHEVVHQRAEALDRAVRSAKPGDEANVEPYAERLRTQFAAGIFAPEEDAPPLAATLPLAATFGTPIEVPGLEEEPPDSVELVTPLAPTEPVVVAGRSMVYKQPLTIGSAEAPDVDDADESVEQPWVTVAAHFPRKAQYQEMINAGYAPYRARVYVAGVEVRRQEMLSNGEWSPWEVISTTGAMPVLDIPEPVFDDEDGSLANKADIDEAFTTIKGAQALIEQPPFYVVDVGDEWKIPPFDWRAELVSNGQELAAAEEPEPTLGMTNRRSASGRTPTMGTGGGRRSSGRSGGRVSGGGFPAQERQVNPRIEARREIRATIERAKKAFHDKDYAQAASMVEDILTNEYATTGNKKDAKQIIRAAGRKLARASAGPPPDRRTLAAQQEYVRHPETEAPAVWFHDDTVASGKTYRYSLRVNLWNRYVGQSRSLKDPDEAKQPVIQGDWSPASDPITVPPQRYFFVTGPVPGSSDEALAEVFKWENGSWIKERFNVKVGDTVGRKGVEVRSDELDENLNPIRKAVDFDTGAVVLDLRDNEPIKQRIPGKNSFQYRDQTSLVLVYLDPADGQVKERAALLDRTDPLREELEEQEAF